MHTARHTPGAPEILPIVLQFQIKCPYTFVQASAAPSNAGGAFVSSLDSHILSASPITAPTVSAALSPAPDKL